MNLLVAVLDVDPGQHPDDERGRHDEADPGHQQAAALRARSQPRWMASSVLLGPRLRLVAPTRSTNRSSVTHRRRRTTWSWIIAMRAAGPPNAVTPSRRHGRVTSQPPAAGLFPGRPPGGVRARPGYGAGSGAGGLEELDHVA
jgi:hypothetical protein